MKYMCNGLYACSPKLASNRVKRHKAKEVGNCFRCPNFNDENCCCSLLLEHYNGECISFDEFNIIMSEMLTAEDVHEIEASMNDIDTYYL